MIRPLCLQCMSRVCPHFDAPPPCLPRRHSELILRLAGGLSNKEIATAMGLSEATVKTYMSSIHPTIGTTTRLELALWGRDHADVLREAAGL